MLCITCLTVTLIFTKKIKMAGLRYITLVQEVISESYVYWSKERLKWMQEAKWVIRP